MLRNVMAEIKTSVMFCIDYYIICIWFRFLNTGVKSNDCFGSFVIWFQKKGAKAVDLNKQLYPADTLDHILHMDGQKI